MTIFFNRDASCELTSTMERDRPPQAIPVNDSTYEEIDLSSIENRKVICTNNTSYVKQNDNGGMTTERDDDMNSSSDYVQVSDEARM